MHTLRCAAALGRKWKEGRERSYIGWVSFNDPAAAEIVVEWGYDGVLIDVEHGTFDNTSLRTTLMAFRGTDCVPIVRAGANDIFLLKTALDLGAGGVLIPLIQNAADARAAVDACRYAPQGSRGVSPRRASNYFRDVDAYLAEANHSLLVMLQIECVAAYEHLDEILAVEGVDCLFVGSADLSATMGHLGNPKHPDVVRVVEDIIRRCRAVGRPVAVAAASNPADVKYWFEAGANAVAFGSDLTFMQMGFAAFKASMQQAGLPFARGS